MPSDAAAGQKPSTVIIVPAQNEAKIIAGTIARLKESVANGTSILVVADNCKDDTAAIARDCGVEVIIRNSRENRGKGFALAFARDHLLSHPPDVVVVVDADCSLDCEATGALAAAAYFHDRPVQSANLLRPDTAHSPLVQMSSFAFMLKNLVRQRGLQRLGGRVHLTGTGMAIPWHLFAASDLATGSLVEDLKLGIELAEAGRAPMLVEKARAWSDAAGAGGTITQRRRWESGFLVTALNAAPPLLARSIRRLDPKGVAAALDLLIPPLALLALVQVAALAIAAVAVFTGAASTWPFIIDVVACLLAAISIVLAWWREGRAFISLGALICIPAYIFWKLPIYLGLVHGTPRSWLRTGR